MTQGYWPGGGCRTCAMATRKLPRSPGPFLVVSCCIIWTHGHAPLHTTCAPRPAGQIGVGRLHYRRVGIYVAYGEQRRSPATISCYLFCGNIFSIVVLWRSKPRLRFMYSYSSRNSNRCPPLLSLTSPPRPWFCAVDLPNPCWTALLRRNAFTCY